jgi:colicin import membrane protein
MKFMAMAAPAAALMAAALLAGCASEPEVSPGPTLPPPGSVAQAEQRLAAVAHERTAIEARFVERERQCYQKFFVTRCLDEAKERRRTALAAQRAIEIEADRYQRQARVDERDRAMAEAEAQYREQEARMTTQPAAAPHQPTEAPPPRPAPVAERIAKHNAKAKQEQQKEAAGASKRAANVREYEERKKDSEERQRKVQERLDEKRAKEEK